MKHYLLSAANGLHTPPINNSHGKSSHFFNFRFSLFTPLLVLFLLIMGNSPAWTSTNYFTPGKTLYFYVDGDCKNWGNNQFAALFYYQNNENKAYGYENENYSARQFIDNNTIGSTNRIKCSKINDNYYSVVIPSNGTANIGYVRLIHLNTDDGWCHQAQQKVSADSFTGTNNCIKFSAWDNGTPTGYEAYNGGECITNACGGGGDTPHTGDKFYIMGSHNGWSKNSEDHKMTIVDGKYAYKTYENITENWDFKVAKEDGTELGWSYFSQSKSDYTCSEVAATISNIRPNTYNGAKNLTIYWDGVNVYVKVENATPAVKYTVTLHPNNGGSDIIRENVPEGSNSSATELNLSAVTYGKGTATWYTDAACTTPFTTVTGDMHLYAKWGVSGNYYFVSCLQTANDNGGNDGYWSNDYGQKLSYSFIAPSGHMPFEIIEDKDWNQKINGGNYADMFDNSQSDVTISAAHNHMDFVLDAPKKVTVSYNGKVTIKTENYSFDNSKTWRIKTSWGNGGNAWNYNTIMTNNGTTNATAILRNVPAGQHSFVVTAKENDNDAMATVGTETFNALYVDTSNPSSGLTWNNTSARRDNSDYFNSTTPQTDNRWRNCSFTLNKESDILITFDGGKIRCDIVAPNIVTFKDGENTLSTQEVSSGNKATKPADPTKAGYTFVKWQLNGSDYNFSSAVNSNITLNAVWAYKSIESVSLNESEHMTWVGNSDFTLTRTYSPSDLITKTVTWSSNNTSVATVSDGTVHAVGAGTATITCTITDMYDNQLSATCEVTVAACEMATDNIYSMTVKGYNTSIGHDADLEGLWNESSDNDGPASLTMYYLTITPNTGGKRYLYADESDHYVKRNTSSSSADNYYWIKEKVGKTGNNLDIYTIKNYGTGLYLASDDDTPITQNWYAHRAIVQADGTSNVAKWHYIDGCGAKLMNVAFSNGDNSYTTHETFLHVDLELDYGTINYHMNDESIVAVGSSDGCQNRQAHRPVFEGERVIDNPNYKASLMNGSYYRMKENATVQANLGGALVPGAVITVRLYADAATTVKLQKTDGTEIETINLSADAEREYTYTGSALVGESAFVIKAADNHAGIASIVATRTYAIRLAQLIEETEIGETLTLTCDYATDNAVINKAITINGQGHTIGNLTVEQTGDLTLSSELTVRDFTICAKAGNTSTPAHSGQVRNASKLKVNGNAYFLYTVDPSGQIHYGWYDFTVPFPINIVSGIKGIQGSELKEDFRNGVDYAVMEYFGDKQAQGQYPYKKFSGIMQPNKLYTITLSDYNTLRMQKTADGALVSGDKVTLNAYQEGDATNANWNGVGNGTLHHADAGISGNFIQVYQSGNRTFLTVNKADYSLVVGSAFMVQETGTMILNQANGNKPLLAPSRYESAPATAIQIASEGKPFSDQLFITASETGGQAYTPGVDVAKAGELGSANVPQIWTNAYNSSLCVHEAQLINGKAQYKLSIYAPVAGAYTLTSKNIPADYSLYLTQNGMIVSELSDTYTLDLSKGITTEYGLLLTEIYNSPTGIENTQTDKIQTTKIIRNGVLYILHNGKVYNAQGAMVK